MVLWCLQLQCHYEDKLNEKGEKYEAALRRVRQCEELRARIAEGIEEVESELRTLRSLMYECEPYIRRKTEAKKVRKRLKNAFILLLGKNRDRKQHFSLTKLQAT